MSYTYQNIITDSVDASSDDECEENSESVVEGSVYQSALKMIGRGWSVIPVYGIRGGSLDRCECGLYPCGAGNQNAGKHPVGRDWNERGLRWGADIHAVFAEGSGASRNVGVLTGMVSGIWVLDIDPKNGGDVTLTRLLREHGPLPATYRVRTGSGGEHYYFRMPDFKLSNSPREFKGLGIDVRADRGQVVGAGSVSGVGRYDVICDAEVAEAPEWLLEMLRSIEVTGSGATSSDVLVEGLPFYADLSSGEQRRVQRYAEAVIEGACRDYAQEPPGYGSIKMFSVACRVLEVVQSPWNEVTADWAYERLDAARQRRLANHPGRLEGGGQSRDELRTTWNSARSRVVGKALEYPAERGAGLMLDVEPLPVRDFIDVASDALSDSGDSGATLRIEAGDAGEVGESMTAFDRMLAEMLTPDDLDALPNPEPLIMDLLDMDSESWIIAEPGGFKSLVALDWAGHVGSGLEWQGCKVRQGNVVYVVAEGSKGIKLRVRAWRETYGEMNNVHFLPRPVQVKDNADWGTLVAVCQHLEPVMIVLDTQARITVGMDENAARDMGELVGAVSALRMATRACVLVVHHVGRNGGDARGSSALDGAQDTEIRVKRPTKKDERRKLTAIISIDKQKDGDESAEFHIKMKLHKFGVDKSTGRELTSLALEKWDPFYEPKKNIPDWIENTVGHKKSILEVMREHFDTTGATRGQIKAVLKERGTLMVDPSFYGSINALVKTGMLEQQGAGRLFVPETFEGQID